MLLSVPLGTRVGELLALQWLDVDFQKKVIKIRKAVWHQHIGLLKTDESEKDMPLDDAMLADLLRWRETTPYAKDSDWVFASARMKALARASDASLYPAGR